VELIVHTGFVGGTVECFGRGTAEAEVEGFDWQHLPDELPPQHGLDIVGVDVV
jgi:hypothetical protein